MLEKALLEMRTRLKGELNTDELHRVLYATDGSIYREMPVGVAYPMDKSDLITLVTFANNFKVPLIPRTAGTSLAGQCVGNGLVVDVSRYMNKILELNVREQWVRVQPGVIRDELNAYLQPYGLFFGPITSTSNRAMIGGMVGNNSSGTTSIKFGVTRDHVLELLTIMSDGSVTVFRDLTREEFFKKCRQDDLEGAVYQQINHALNNPVIAERIREGYPKPSIHRRNTGYAVDALLNTNVFDENGPNFNFCKLLCGSEGTLALTAEIKLHLNPLPPAHEVLICAHFSSLNESLRATIVAMRHQPYGCELMDKTILDCTKENREQRKNRFFVEGDPAAMLIVEVRGQSKEEANRLADELIGDFKAEGMGFAFPKVEPPMTKRVWALRAAGFGVLSNLKGDSKPLEFVEDTAVELADLPDYIAAFESMLNDFGDQAVYYAHAGAGELHVRPKVNLKTSEGIAKMREIAFSSAKLVKKYRGSLSGEHGDGRVRAEFIPLVLGQENYSLLREIKQVWDPNRIINPGKIVDAPPMDTSLRYEADIQLPEPATVFNFKEEGGMLRLAEKCSGSGDCRKLAHVSGGVMCPSYMATRNEKDTTRARANALREFLTRKFDPARPLAHPELKEVMDLCLSCKGCASECPSNVDMATLKAEFLYHYQNQHGVPFRAKIFGQIGRWNGLAARIPTLANWMISNRWTAVMVKKMLGVHPSRTLPKWSRQSWRSWFEKNTANQNLSNSVKGRVFLFCDEFTNFNESAIGIKAVQLLWALGYEVLMPDHPESGRAAISKGLLMHAKHCASRNFEIFKELITPATPLIGIEPSAILTFRDEYPRLVDPEKMQEMRAVAENVLTIDEFIFREMENGNINSHAFTSETRKVLFHAHCHQKVLSSVEPTIAILSLPKNYNVELIPAGCCGMAGSFGYEKEHYDLSVQIGELVLFPALRREKTNTLIAATGTSCRHQILDGTGRVALHPIEILWEACLHHQQTAV